MKFSIITLATAVPALAAAVPGSVDTTEGMFVVDDSEGEGSPGHDLYLKDFNSAAHYFELITGCDTVRKL
ncbi:hypothetical protein FPCIR_12824 [Fusarium pseudocircinatum]|uniref:Uncharacterized protein n=1 Tax=Fusarium pseudocircinatum TaxID=56676 RepID=A0A8H5NRE3_9HYPO|nr:hypothetical protein FPCIR_12824 [Fusarium pseudocircinatum]